MLSLIFRLLFKAMLPLFAMMGAGAYFMYMQGYSPFEMFGGASQQFAQTLKKLDTSVTSQVNAVKASVTSSSAPDDQVVKRVVASKQRTFYRWEDAQGRWFYGDNPPPDAKRLRKIAVNSEQNVLAAPATEVSDNVVKAARVSQPSVTPVSAAAKSAALELPEGVQNPYSPGGVQHLIDQAKQIQKIMDQRNQITNELIQQQ